MGKTYIIAEAGVNHNGSIELAKRLIEKAAEAGADAVKFQSFKAELITSKTAPKAEYQIANTKDNGSQYEMIKKLELDEDMHYQLCDYCKTVGIEFSSTAFDVPSVELLSALGINYIKIPSGEVNNAHLILKMASTGLPIILSTGMCTLADVEEALGMIAFGLLGKENPSAAAFKEAYSNPEAQRLIREKVTLLHCTTEYPAPMNEVNLKAMITMQQAFGLPVGYSDHTPGITIPIAAVAMGAIVIEKHFTLDKTMEGPDHKASLEPDELKAMVKGIREVEQALGDGRKLIAPVEQKNIAIARRSLVAKRDIQKGEVFSNENLYYMRPGTGISPVYYFDYLGQTAEKDFRKDEPIS